MKTRSNRKKRKPAVKINGNRSAKLGWTQNGKNKKTLVDLERINDLENEMKEEYLNTVQHLPQ